MASTVAQSNKDLRFYNYFRNGYLIPRQAMPIWLCRIPRLATFVWVLRTLATPVCMPHNSLQNDPDHKIPVSIFQCSCLLSWQQCYTDEGPALEQVSSVQGVYTCSPSSMGERHLQLELGELCFCQFSQNVLFISNLGFTILTNMMYFQHSEISDSGPILCVYSSYKAIYQYLMECILFSVTQSKKHSFTLYP